MPWKKLTLLLSEPVQDETLLFSVLSGSTAIPVWEIDVALPCEANDRAAVRLVRQAQQMEHIFGLSMPWEALRRFPKEILARSSQVTLVLEERQTPLCWEDFFRELQWAKQAGVPMTVHVQLTEGMLRKVLENLLLPRLLTLAEKIRFHVPKDEHRPCMTRERFGFFLDYIAMKMLRMRVLKKIEIDACMIPALSLTPRKQFTQCARQNTLILDGEGYVKICPYGPAIGRVENAQEFETMKRMLNRKRYRDMLAHCIWREDWNLQEKEMAYRLH